MAERETTSLLSRSEEGQWAAVDGDLEQQREQQQQQQQLLSEAAVGRRRWAVRGAAALTLLVGAPALAGVSLHASGRGRAGDAKQPTKQFGRAASGTTMALREESESPASFASLPSSASSTSSSSSSSSSSSETASSGKSKSKNAQPHIVLFTVDDMGWNDVGFHSSDIPEATLYMNELVTKSIYLSQYYTQPSCTPSRATIMSGKWAFRNGFQNYELQAGERVGLPLSNKLMPEYLSDLGYRTHMVGKWNIGHCNVRYLPHERGFDSMLAYMSPGHGYRDFVSGHESYARDLLEGHRTYDESSGNMEYSFSVGSAYLGQYDTLLYKKHSAKRIREHAEQFGADGTTPFFLWSAQHGIHGEDDSDPLPPAEMLSATNKAYLEALRAIAVEAPEVRHPDAPDVAAEVEEHAEEEQRTALAEMAAGENGDLELKSEGYFFKDRLVTASVLMSIDHALKSLVEVLDEVGMLQNAVLLVNSDNGGDTKYTAGHPGNNFPLRSAKFGYYEGGIRVPAFVYAPWVEDFETKYGGTKYHGLMHHVDLLTTFVGLASEHLDESSRKWRGAADPAEKDGLDGYNMWPYLMAGDGASPRSELVLNMPRLANWTAGERLTNEGVALRMGKYKLLLNHAVDSWFSPAVNSANWHDTTVMFSSLCTYNFYDLDKSSPGCEFRDFLYNVVDDPDEHHNLLFVDEYKGVVESMIQRARKILQSQRYQKAVDYGKIVAEFHGVSLATTSKKAEQGGDPYRAWELNDNFVVPWGCEAIQ